jgi:hypothetical protein
LSRKCDRLVSSTARCRAAITTVEATSHPSWPAPTPGACCPAANKRSRTVALPASNGSAYRCVPSLADRLRRFGQFQCGSPMEFIQVGPEHLREGRELIAVNAAEGLFELFATRSASWSVSRSRTGFCAPPSSSGVDRQELAQQLATLGKRKPVERRGASSSRAHDSPQVHPAGW